MKGSCVGRCSCFTFILTVRGVFFVKCFGYSDRSSIFALAIGNPVRRFAIERTF